MVRNTPWTDDEVAVLEEGVDAHKKQWKKIKEDQRFKGRLAARGIEAIRFKWKEQSRSKRDTDDSSKGKRTEEPLNLLPKLCSIKVAGATMTDPNELDAYDPIKQTQFHCKDGFTSVKNLTEILQKKMLEESELANDPSDAERLAIIQNNHIDKITALLEEMTFQTDLSSRELENINKALSEDNPPGIRNPGVMCFTIAPMQVLMECLPLIIGIQKVIDKVNRSNLNEVEESVLTAMVKLSSIIAETVEKCVNLCGEFDALLRNFKPNNPEPMETRTRLVGQFKKMLESTYGSILKQWRAP